jgi:polyhydroxyalkanoate synthesis repressor PhaR
MLKPELKRDRNNFMKNEQVIIKKYNNRRLYNTQTSSYITLQDIFEMIRSKTDFIVVDSKTNQDLTHSTIVQIILDQETKGYNLLPTEFLKQIILCYNEQTNNVMQSFLENVMGMFNQYSESKSNPLKGLEEIGKQNLKFFEQAFSFFDPNKKNDKPE